MGSGVRVRFKFGSKFGDGSKMKRVKINIDKGGGHISGGHAIIGQGSMVIMSFQRARVDTLF